MRIALINGAALPTPPRDYGSEVITGQLAASLADRGHEVHLFAPGGSIAPPGVTLHYVPGTYGMINPAVEAYPATVYRDLLLRCEVIHDLSGSCAVIEALGLNPQAPPMLYTRNGIDFNRPRWHRQNAVVLSQAALRCAQAGQSAWHGTEFAHWDLPPGQLSTAAVVPYGIDTLFYSPGSDPVEDYVLYVGRPHPSKGVDHIIQLASLYPDQAFVLAWRPAFADHREWDRRYRQQVRTMGLDNVTILTLPLDGHHAAKRDLYRRAKVFLQPTRYIEAFGLTAIEAMACGCPVVLEDRGSAPEIVEEGVTGYLHGEDLDVEDYGPLLERAARLDRSRIRQEAIGRFSTFVMAGRYQTLYERLQRGENW